MTEATLQQKQQAVVNCSKELFLLYIYIFISRLLRKTKQEEFPLSPSGSSICVFFVCLFCFFTFCFIFLKVCVLLTKSYNLMDEILTTF